MQGFESIGRWIMVIGVVMLIIGGLVWLLGRLKVFESLPGVFRIQAGGLNCVVPILASIIISVLLTIFANIILRMINR